MQLTQRSVEGFNILDATETRIVSINPGPDELTISVGDVVISNGRMELSGLTGVVVDICEPWTKGRTEDIFLVRWCSGHLSNMKYEDLDLKALQRQPLRFHDIHHAFWESHMSRDPD